MLLEVLTRLAIVVAIMLAISIPVIVGIGQFWDALRGWRPRVRAVAPIAAVLIPVLLLNRFARQGLVNISREYGIRMGGIFWRIEGEFILLFQEIATTPVTQYFSFIYIYAYAFLLIFPVIAYFTLTETRTLRLLLAAYTLNYAIGITLYVLFHAWGPRQYLGFEIEWMLYDFQPSYQHLTREVNHNTNVFPSLHTSLAATVAIFAYRTRREFPLWTPIAIVIAVSVWISTMYLGIHWAIDVIAGLVLAAICVTLADRYVGRWPVYDRIEPVYERFGTPVAARLKRVSDRFGRS